MAVVSRNDPCPCGSGRRYKHCCGADAGAGAPARRPEAAAAASPDAAPILSVVLPFYRRFPAFRQALAHNAQWFARDGLEVVIAMDDPADERELVELARAHPGIRWKIVVNDVPHPWRPPCRAINVGLRHASGRYVFVASPESAYAGDAPGIALDAVKDFPGGIAVGRVEFASFRDLRWGRSIAQHFAEIATPSPTIVSYYGSICAPRAAFEAIHGYDEALAGWGGDDDNVRLRLEMAGGTLLACDRVRLLHLSFDERRHGRNARHDPDPAATLAKLAPENAIANRDGDWGREFSRIAYISAAVRRPGGAPALDDAPPVPPPPPGSVVPTPWLRACPRCGRMLCDEETRAPCAECAPIAEAAAPGPAVRARRRPRVAAVMQLRNEAYWLPGCLDHLRGHVDAIVALDDGSTDATAALLEREPSVADRIANPPSPEHAWRERDNKLRLVERARELGFDWVLCCDADERYESGFLSRLRMIAGAFLPGDVVSVAVSLKELWDSPRHYRQDGVWGTKTRARFFRVPPRVAYDLDSELHGQWYPDHLRKYGRIVPIDLRLYHLKSIRREDRLRRRDFYNAIDPHRRYQPEGYDYLALEPDDMLVEAIAPGREYDFGTVPDDLRP